MVMEIDGVDITPYMSYKGLKYTTFDLDSDEAGRTLDGNMVRSRVATKVRWDVQVKPLRTAELMQLLQLISPETVQVKATDLMHGVRTGIFYSNNNSMQIEITSADESGELWSEFSFPLIEI